MAILFSEYAAVWEQLVQTARKRCTVQRRMRRFVAQAKPATYRGGRPLREEFLR